MYDNTLGIQGKGNNKSISSPGVSALFGSYPTPSHNTSSNLQILPISTSTHKPEPPKAKQKPSFPQMAFEGPSKIEDVPTVTQARLAYRKKQLETHPSPQEIAETVNSGIEKNKAELRTLVHQQTRAMKTDLKTQVHVKESFQKLEKDSHRAQHNADTGFEFEWYQRYPRMQQQNRDIRNIQKEQRFHDKQRIQQAALEEKKKPPSVLSPQEYDRIAKESKQELYEAKTEMQKSLKKDYDTTLKSSKTASALAKQQKIQEENAQLERTRKNIQAEKFHLGQQKRQRNLEMNQALNSVDTKKRAEWKDKVNDHSNQELTEKLQHEKQRLVDDLANERSKMKQDYSQSLSKQSYHNKEKKLRDIKEQKAGYKGINFECYARDIVIEGFLY